MKKIIKISLTNWINIIIVYSSMFITLFVFEIAFGFLTIGEALYNTFGRLIVYYLHYWLGFAFVMAILDLLLFNLKRLKIGCKLAIEWLLISLPFIYWIFNSSPITE